MAAHFKTVGHSNRGLDDFLYIFRDGRVERSPPAQEMIAFVFMEQVGGGIAG